MSIIETRGHRLDQPGLRGNSVGNHYPFIISAIGRDQPDTGHDYYLHHVNGWTLRNGDGSVRRLSHDDAESLALTILEAGSPATEIDPSARYLVLYVNPNDPSDRGWWLSRRKGLADNQKFACPHPGMSLEGVRNIILIPCDD